MIRILAALALVAPLPVFAQVPDLSECGAPITITRSMLAEVDQFRTAPLAGKDAILIAQFPEAQGTAAFVRRGGKWRGYALGAGNGIEQVYRAPASGNVFVWTFHGFGDPPQLFTGASFSGKLGPRFCTSEVKVPTAVNRGDDGEWEWRGESFAFEHFNVDGAGGAAITGTAEIEVGGQTRSAAFRYYSRDGGRTWAQPFAVRRAHLVDGLYQPIDDQSQALLADLRKHAR